MESLIRDYLAQLLLKEFEFPAIVTLMEVKIDDEFKKAKAKIKILPFNIKNSNNFKKEAVEILNKLNQDTEKIFKILLKKLNIKPLPKIYFELF